MVEAGNPRVSVDSTQCRPQLGVGRLRPGQPQVVPDAAHEHVVLLVDQGNVTPDLLGRHLVEGRTTQGDVTDPRRVDTGQQPAQRRFPCSRRAYERNPRTRLHSQRDAVQHVSPFQIAEPHLVGQHSPAFRIVLVARRGLLDLTDPDQPGQ
jgi:hypothetical protein